MVDLVPCTNGFTTDRSITDDWNAFDKSDNDGRT